MTNRISFLGFLFVVASVVSASISANAGEVDVTAATAGSEMLGTVAPGQMGTISNDYSANSVTGGGSVSGTLGANEEIIFTYSFIGLDPGASLISTGSAGSNFAYASSFAPPVSSGLIVASANLPSLSGGETTITNKSAGSISFSSFFSGFFSGFNSSSLKLSYQVISTVPLPATLGMFGTMMLALLGFSWFKRRNSEAAA